MVRSWFISSQKILSKSLANFWGFILILIAISSQLWQFFAFCASFLVARGQKLKNNIVMWSHWFHHHFHPDFVVVLQNSEWEKSFSQINLDSLKVVYLHQPALNQGRLDHASMTCYFEILRELSELCFNDHIYQVQYSCQNILQS